jgi:hypothetical protein
MNTLEQNSSKIIMEDSRTDSQRQVIPFPLAIMFAIISTACPGAAAISAPNQPVIDNERVAVADVRSLQPPAQHDFVSVSLSHPGKANFGHKGAAPGAAGARTVVIELKDGPVGPLANSTPYPLAFPRPGAHKLLENDRVIVWQYAWHAHQPTPMHFHDKDALVVFEGNGTIKSTTLEGESTLGTFKFGDIRFNPRGRIHTEILVSGEGRAVITELK